MDFKVNQLVRTRAGKPARIIATDALGGRYPIVALVEEVPGYEAVHSFQSNGGYSLASEHYLDLVNVEPEQKAKPVVCFAGIWYPHFQGGAVVYDVIDHPKLGCQEVIYTSNLVASDIHPKDGFETRNTIYKRVSVA